ncbi:MAG: DoxX family protein, partial [Pseudolabrys sp.]
GLAGFYEKMLPVAATLVRFVVGVMFLMHVWGKFNAGAARIAGGFGSNYHLPMPELFAYTAMGLELVGGVCLIIGLFTRFFAAALAVEMGIALIVAHLPKGYAAGTGGYEYVLLIGVVLLAIAMRGGGPYSVDAKIGKEL